MVYGNSALKKIEEKNHLAQIKERRENSFPMLEFLLAGAYGASMLFLFAMFLTNMFDPTKDEHCDNCDTKIESDNEAANESVDESADEWDDECATCSSESATETKPNIAFITLTNDGYVKFTLNCLRSLSSFESSPQTFEYTDANEKEEECVTKDQVIPLHVHCIGNECANALQMEGYKVSLIGNADHLSRRQVFRKGSWGALTQKKFEIIYENLLVHDFVCITDGDVVFCKPFWRYLQNTIGDKDLLIQNDTLDDNCHDNLCSGFMFIRKNENTLRIFHPHNTKHRVYEVQFDDQVYINEVKFLLNYALLPLNLFPNGKYFYQNSQTIDPLMVHFNWTQEKFRTMTNFNMNFLSSW